jgi:hypothetical protein
MLVPLAFHIDVYEALSEILSLKGNLLELVVKDTYAFGSHSG